MWQRVSLTRRSAAEPRLLKSPIRASILNLEAGAGIEVTVPVTFRNVLYANLLKPARHRHAGFVGGYRRRDLQEPCCRNNNGKPSLLSGGTSLARIRPTCLYLSLWFLQLPVSAASR